MDVPKANPGRDASSIPIKVGHKTSLPTSPLLLPFSRKYLPVQLESECDIIKAGGEGIMLLSLLLGQWYEKLLQAICNSVRQPDTKYTETTSTYKLEEREMHTIHRVEKLRDNSSP